MKTLKFNEKLVPLVLSGEKTSTWRVFDEKDLTVGDELTLINKQTMEVFTEAVIVGVEEKQLKDITREMEVASGHETFESDEERLRVYKSYYGDEVTNDTVVKMIQFELK
jgi:hypothetical protein